ncbi:MAG: cyclophilin-like family protein [bacterium]
MQIIIESKSISRIYAKITRENPKTVGQILKILPITGNANLWGDEIYFKIPIDRIEPENPRTVVKKGKIGIGITEPSFCIFFE